MLLPPGWRDYGQCELCRKDEDDVGCVAYSDTPYPDKTRQRITRVIACEECHAQLTLLDGDPTFLIGDLIHDWNAYFYMIPKRLNQTFTDYLRARFYIEKGGTGGLYGMC